MGEFELIDDLLKRISYMGSNVLVSGGDDAAVIRNGERYTVVTTDALVEGTHYRSSWKKKVDNLYTYIGRKLLSISLSDLASMGGFPNFAVVNLGLRKDYSLKDVEGIYDGLSSCASEYRVSVVGGDTVRAPSEFLTLSLTGSSSGFMLRRNASPGDLIAVTGSLGDAKVGLEVLEGRMEVEDEGYFIERFLNPIPRVEEGIYLLNSGVRCCTDVSDGFLFNLSTITRSSGLRAEIFSERVPISERLERVPDAFEFALYGGEDYELLFTFPERLMDRFERNGFEVVGVLKAGEGIFIDGEPVQVRGFDHFKEE